MAAVSSVRFGKRDDDVKATRAALTAAGVSIPAGPPAFFGEQKRPARNLSTLISHESSFTPNAVYRDGGNGGGDRSHPAPVRRHLACSAAGSAW